MKRVIQGLVVVCVLVLAPGSMAFAEQQVRFQIDTPPFSGVLSSLHSEDNAASEINYARQAEVFSVELPGTGTSADFYLVGKEEVAVPLWKQGEYAGTFFVEVFEVSDFDARYGYVVSPLFSSGELGVQVYATIADTSRGDVTDFLQIIPVSEPAVDEYGVHEVAHVSGQEIRLLLGDLADDMVPRPQEAAASRTSTLRTLAQTDAMVLPGANGWREIDFVVDASGDFVRGRSDEQAASQIVSTVAAANLYFEPLQLYLRLRAVRLFDKNDPQDPYYQATVQQDAREMLEVVRAQWKDEETPQRDIGAVLASSRFANIYGLAYPSTSCVIPDYAFLFATQGGESATAVAGLSATIAHEIGHIIGMGHEAQGTSLMSPYFVADPDGFSDYSIDEYLDHAGSGGAACFSEMSEPPEPTPPPDEDPHFEGGDEQEATIAEGQRLVRTFKVAGGLPGASYQATGLPKGAALDQTSGLFEYTPDFDTADSLTRLREFSITIEAISPFGSATTHFTLRVQNVNRPPDLFVEGGESVEIEQGELLQLRVEALDPDYGDSALVELLSQADFEALPGTKQISVSAWTADIMWQVPEGLVGDYYLLFRARDNHGSANEKRISVKVVVRNAPPVIDAPDEILVSPGELLDLTVQGYDPEGEAVVFDFQGVPAGSLVYHSAGKVRIEYAHLSGQAAQVLLTVSATDGVKVTRKTIKVSFSDSVGVSGQMPQISWPGQPTETRSKSDYDGDGREEVALYDAASGRWVHLDCNGQAVRSTHFGGFIGDIPVSYQRNGQALRAVYRVIGDYGYWYIDDEQEVRVIPWGLKGDVPVTGDFDGDGTSDLGIYRPSTKEWHIAFSAIPSQVLADTGLGADSGSLVFPFAADLDGDQRDDRLLFVRKSDGTAVFHAWLARGEQMSFVVSRVDLSAAMIPVIGDIDGDGRGDLGVWSVGGSIDMFLSESGVVRRRAVNNSSSALLAAVECAQGEGADIVLVDTNERTLTRVTDGVSVAAVSLEAGDTAGEFLTVDDALRRRSSTMLKARIGDVDGDGTAQPSVWRVNTANGSGQWFEWNQVLNQGPYPALSTGFGYPVAGDFLGSGKSALTFFANGVWTSQDETGSRLIMNWGEAGDVPVPGDYNGDGRTEYAIFRPGDSTWWILFVGADGSQTSSFLPWGETGDIPVPADYDGDGVTDIAVFRGNTGEWYIRFSDGRVQVETFGEANDMPMPADYTGCGRAALAVWRPSDGTWYIKQAGSTEKVLVRQWGLADDLPLRGDFNGDGRADLVVWRPANGTWYIQTLDSLSPQIMVWQFGLFGDTPLGATNTISMF